MTTTDKNSPSAKHRVPKYRHSTVHYQSIDDYLHTQCKKPLFTYDGNSIKKTWDTRYRITIDWDRVTCKQCLRQHPTSPINLKTGRKRKIKKPSILHYVGTGQETLCGRDPFEFNVEIVYKATKITCKACLKRLPTLKLGDKLRIIPAQEKRNPLN